MTPDPNSVKDPQGWTKSFEPYLQPQALADEKQFNTDYDLVPKASQPVRVVRTAYVEADGERLPDPDPANIAKREFAWMTIHKYQANKEFKLPFKGLSTLSVD